MNLSESIQGALGFLVRDRGYQLAAVSDGIDGTVSYRSPVLWIIAEWDRGLPWLEFSAATSFDRFDWDLVEYVLAERDVYRERECSAEAEPNALAGYLRQKLDRIESMFAPERYRATDARLRQLSGQRAALWAERSRGKRSQR